ncbi:hypothetical protein ABZP36_036230 [Zizania latifolia]
MFFNLVHPSIDLTHLNFDLYSGIFAVEHTCINTCTLFSFWNIWLRALPIANINACTFHTRMLDVLIEHILLLPLGLVGIFLYLGMHLKFWILSTTRIPRES